MNARTHYEAMAREAAEQFEHPAQRLLDAAEVVQVNLQTYALLLREMGLFASADLAVKDAEHLRDAMRELLAARAGGPSHG